MQDSYSLAEDSPSRTDAQRRQFDLYNTTRLTVTDPDQRTLVDHEMMCYLLAEYDRGTLSAADYPTLLKLCRTLFHMGAYRRLHQVTTHLAALDGYKEYHLLASLDAMARIDYTAFESRLNALFRSYDTLSDMEKAEVLINLIHVYYSEGRGHDSKFCIPLLEDLVFRHGITLLEAFDSLIRDYEDHHDHNSLDRIISHMQSMPYADFNTFLLSAEAIRRHYKRTNDVAGLQRLVDLVVSKSREFTLDESQQRCFELQMVKILFDSQINAWMDESIHLFRLRDRYLRYDRRAAIAFAEMFLYLLQFADRVYGQQLCDQAVDDVGRAITNALQPYIDAMPRELAMLPDDAVAIKLQHLRHRILHLTLRHVTRDITIEEFALCKRAVYRQALSLCDAADNTAARMQWSVEALDDMMAMDPCLDAKQDIAQLAAGVRADLERYDYHPSFAYQMIHVANVFDYLGDEASARSILRHYNDTDDSYTVYALGVQTIYRRLLIKYDLRRPDDPDMALAAVTHEIETLNKARDIRTAIILVDSNLQRLNLDGHKLPDGVRRESVLRFLQSGGHVYINGNRFDDAIRLVDMHHNYSHGWTLDAERAVNVLRTEAQAWFRKGYAEKAIMLIDDYLATATADLPDVLRLALLKLKGTIETKAFAPAIKINALSDALALAEAIGEPASVAEIYVEMSHMFSYKFPALGLSMLRKAEKIYHDIDDRRSITDVLLLKAQMSMNIHLLYAAKYGPNTQPLHAEAERIIGMVKRWDLRQESTIAFYDRISGILRRDPAPLWDAFRFYRKIDAPIEAFELAQAIFTIESQRGNFDQAIRAARQYLDLALSRNDRERIDAVKQFIEALEHGCKVDFPIFVPKPDEPTTLLHILDAISFDEEIFALESPNMRPFFPGHSDEGKCTPMQLPDGTVGLMPVALLPLQYYRGQSQRHRPCRPTLYRPAMTETDRYRARVQLCEFRALIDSHPLSDLYSHGIYFDFPDGRKLLPLNIYHLALAQHYGIATEIIDVTTDKWVAAFFAATRGVDNHYTVYDHPGERGVFYIYRDRNINRAADPVIPIGLQPFPRPGEQSGLSYRMTPDDDFERHCQVIEFVHDTEVNQLIFNYANRAKKLFPDDLLVEKVDTLLASNTYSDAAYSAAHLEYYPDTASDTLARWQREAGMRRAERAVVTFTDDELRQFQRQLPQHLRRLHDHIVVSTIIHTSPDGTTTLHAVPANHRHIHPILPSHE